MKIDRLIGILTLLLRRDNMTISALAARFEVSERTIRRDLDALCRAGVPVATRQGSGGGVSIAEGYRMDRTLLTPEDWKAILCGLRGLDTVSDAPRAQTLADRLTPAGAEERGEIEIDLGSFYANDRAEKIAALRRAIAGHRLVAFHYSAASGTTDRAVEPYRLLFRWSDWYLSAFCTLRRDYRLFRLSRMWDVAVTEERFAPRPDGLEQGMDDRYFAQKPIRLRARFDPSVRWRLIEEYGPASFTEEPDGWLLLERDYVSYENLKSWVLSFGACVRVERPDKLRQELLAEAREMVSYYRK